MDRQTLRAIVVALALLVPGALRAQATDQSLKAKLHERYGRNRVAYHQMPTFRRLDLFLTDTRHTAPGVVAADTALAVARLAARNLPASYRPDSIRVAITTAGAAQRHDSTRSWLTVRTWATGTLQER